MCELILPCWGLIKLIGNEGTGATFLRDRDRGISSSAPTSNVSSSVESTPGRWVGMRDGLMVSMPGTPLSTTSHLSNRSSGDSYSSSSSTRQLLAAANSHQDATDAQDKVVQL